MERNLIYGIIVAVLIALVIFLIGPEGVINSREGKSINNSSPNNQTPQVTGNLSESFTEANNKFASDLYSEYKSKEGNVFFSPYSISSALTITYEGAKGETAKEMQDVLNLPEKKEKLRSDFANIYDRLNNGNKSYNLSTANALWAQKDFPFREEYFSIIDRYYHGRANNMDFENRPEESRITINNWVENKTNNKIKNLIPRGVISTLTRLVLTNTIYFKADWEDKFDLQNTRNDTFELSSGKEIKTEMMHETSQYNYEETDKVKILELDYEGENLSMLVVLPKKNNFQEVENSFSVEKLDEWRNGINEEKVRVSLPKFKFKTKYFMKETLKKIGMSTAFSRKANFSGMVEGKNISIDEVIHQTFVEVAENGTEAAAATAVVMVEGATPGEEEKEKPKIFNANHSFMFLIQEEETGNILFMGRLSNPKR